VLKEGKSNGETRLFSKWQRIEAISFSQHPSLSSKHQIIYIQKNSQPLLSHPPTHQKKGWKCWVSTVVGGIMWCRQVAENLAKKLKSVVKRDGEK
jgi:hypothetical protein